ncbi:MAG: polysaccharide pyruvyl transferase CsaB [Synergistaceae bacterium]|nr:polysaccharide pyruvyl transferase CsaB [Synergistaceae bacterium]
MSRRYRAVLCGYYGFGNLGDELLASALIEAFRRAGVPGGELAILSASPAETEKSLSIKAFDRWKLAEVFRAVRESDTLLLGGGGLFQDATSIRSSAYYWGAIRLASLAGAIPWAVGQSVGPFSTLPGMFFARNALGKCPQLSVRDERSYELMSSWRFKSSRTPDPVFLLAGDREIKEGGKTHFLVNIRPWGGSLPLRTVTRAARMAAEKKLPVIGVGLSEGDVTLMEKLARSRHFQPERITLLSAANWRTESEALLGSAAGAVSMRYHFSLLALLSGVPLTLSAYDPKVEELAMEWRLPVWKGEGRLPQPALSPEAKKTGQMSEAFMEEFRRMWDEIRRLVERKRQRCQ